VVTVTLSTTLECTADEAWERVRTWALLRHIAAPLIRFTPKDSAVFPAHLEPGEFRTWMWLFGVIPLGWQAVVISEPPPDGATRFIRDKGYSPLIKRWDHSIAITPTAEGKAHYIDRVDIDAGPFTPLVHRFARVFFAHRQRRWRALARSGFVGLAG